MNDLSRRVTPIPPEQESIRATCMHPTGSFIKSEKEEVEQSVASRFEKIVAKDPDRIALTSRNDEYTYDELNVTANRLARAVLDIRGEGEEPIAILLDHDAPLVSAVLGILKAGKICVPL